MEKIKAFCVKYGALILIFLMCLMLRGCLDVYSSMKQPPDAGRTEADGPDNGSFTVGVPGTIFSDDGKLYAEQSLERDESIDVNIVNVTVYSAENDLPVYEFYTTGSMDFHGICFEPGSYNIWVQTTDMGVYCMRWEDSRWVKDLEIEKPASIVTRQKSKG